MNFRKTSYWKIFRLVFVIFSLYLLGDAFYRWDGFRYYASFPEFIPAVALVLILWSMLAVVATLLVWLAYIAVKGILRPVKPGIMVEHFLVFICISIITGIILWIAKALTLKYLFILIEWKLYILLPAAGAAIFVSWLLRNRAAQWIGIIQQRITPLVWLFGFLVTAALPVVTYHTWMKPESDTLFRGVAAGGDAGVKRPNIILVTFDSLTARDMSVYGYERPTTPFMSKWAAESASLFTNAKAESYITTPTTASLMTGKRLWTHQTYQIAGSSKPVKSNTESLPLELKKRGYYNMAFIVNPFASVRKLGVSGAFDIAPVETGFSRQATLFGKVDDMLYSVFGNRIRLYDWIVQRDFIFFKILKNLTQNFSKTTAPPEKAFNKFLSVLDRKPPEPFFAWIHLYPPHDPYLPPEPYMGIFDSSPALRTYKSQEEAVDRAMRYVDPDPARHSFPPDAQVEVDILRARYDEFIRYCDKQFEDFMTELAARGRLKDSVVILSSDHGESFEHGLIKHGNDNLYEQITHIPLIISEPGQTRGRTIDTLVEQVDIPATILDLADIPVPSWMEGRSLVPLMRGGTLPERPAFSMALEGQPSRGRRIVKGRFAVWEGDYKLIYYLQRKISLLFNLKEDPGELNNIFDKEPEVGKRLRKLLMSNLKEANERIAQQNRR